MLWSHEHVKCIQILGGSGKGDTSETLVDEKKNKDNSKNKLNIIN